MKRQGVRPSVRLFQHKPQQQPLLPAGDIDRLLHGAQQRGGILCHMLATWRSG